MRHALRRPADGLRRAISLATLLAFFVANLGLPLMPVAAEQADGAMSAGAAAPAPPSQKPSCCCGTGAKSSACGCCRLAPDGKAPGCCAARPVANSNDSKPGPAQPGRTPSKEIPTTPVVSCPCGGAPATDFIIAAQPKLAAATMDVARPLPTADVIGLESLHSIGLRSAPELPPPRVSAC